MPRATSLLVLACITATGCGQRTVYVRYGEVHRHLGELRARGEAEVETRELDSDDDPASAPAIASESTTKISFDRSVTVAATATTLRKLAEGCRDLPPFRGAEGPKPCGLVRYRDAHFVVDEKTIAPDHGTITGVLIATMGLAAIGGGIYCGFECDDKPEAKAVGLIAGGLAILLVAAVKSGARD